MPMKNPIGKSEMHINNIFVVIENDEIISISIGYTRLYKNTIPVRTNSI